MKLFKLTEIELGFLVALILGLAGTGAQTWIETTGLKKMEFFEFLKVFLINMPENLIFGCFAAAAILIFSGHLRNRHKKPDEKEDNDA